MRAAICSAMIAGVLRRGGGGQNLPRSLDPHTPRKSVSNFKTRVPLIGFVRGPKYLPSAASLYARWFVRAWLDPPILWRDLASHARSACIPRGPGADGGVCCVRMASSGSSPDVIDQALGAPLCRQHSVQPSACHCPPHPDVDCAPSPGTSHQCPQSSQA